METRNKRKRTIRLDRAPPSKPSKADQLLSEVQPAFEVDASLIEMKGIINEGVAWRRGRIKARAGLRRASDLCTGGRTLHTRAFGLRRSVDRKAIQLAHLYIPFPLLKG